MNEISDFIQSLDIPPEDVNIWEPVIEKVFKKFGYLSLT
jgi:hypothetical protein